MEGLVTAALIALTVTVGVLWYMLFRQSGKMFRLRDTLEESEARRRELSSFLNRFSAGIQGEDGIAGALEAAAFHIGEQTDAESVGIYEMEGSVLHGVGVYGVYPLVHVTNKLVFTRRRHLMEAMSKEKIAPGEGFFGGIVISREPELVAKGSEDPRFSSYPDSDRLGGIMAVPLILDGAVVGVICAVNNRLAPGKPFTQAQFDRLRRLAPQVLMIRNLVLIYDEINRRDRIDQELELARLLQQSQLPKTMPQWGDFSICATTRSAKEVDGDFYDFIQIDDDRMLVLLGDACGKGIPACMLTAMTRSIARALASNFTTLNEFLCKLSNQLNRDTDADRFITLGCCLLDKKNMLLEFARAGHTDLLTFVHKHIRVMSPKGVALGIMPPRFVKFDTICIALESGTSVLMYSDGFTEAVDAQGVEFGKERLIEAFSSGCNEWEKPADILESISRRIIDYEASQADDQTLVLIRRT